MVDVESIFCSSEKIGLGLLVHMEILVYLFNDVLCVLCAISTSFQCAFSLIT